MPAAAASDWQTRVVLISVPTKTAARTGAGLHVTPGCFITVKALLDGAELEQGAIRVRPWGEDAAHGVEVEPGCSSLNDAATLDLVVLTAAAGVKPPPLHGHSRLGTGPLKQGQAFTACYGALDAVPATVAGTLGAANGHRWGFTLMGETPPQLLLGTPLVFDEDRCPALVCEDGRQPRAIGVMEALQHSGFCEQLGLLPVRGDDNEALAVLTDILSTADEESSRLLTELRLWLRLQESASVKAIAEELLRGMKSDEGDVLLSLHAAAGALYTAPLGSPEEAAALRRHRPLTRLLQVLLPHVADWSARSHPRWEQQQVLVVGTQNDAWVEQLAARWARRKAYLRADGREIRGKHSIRVAQDVELGRDSVKAVLVELGMVIGSRIGLPFSANIRSTMPEIEAALKRLDHRLARWADLLKKQPSFEATHHRLYLVLPQKSPEEDRLLTALKAHLAALGVVLLAPDADGQQIGREDNLVFSVAEILALESTPDNLS